MEIDRHRAQHDRRQHAHRRPAEAVAVADRRAAGQQEELKKTNDRLEQQATIAAPVRRTAARQAGRAAADQRRAGRQGAAAVRAEPEVEAKNREVEQAKRALEEKAEQLALTSKYKSEFLANMSHELRTPLNSLLILSKLLSRKHPGQPDRQAGRVRRTPSTPRAPTCSALINDILDLSKIESGTVTLDIGETSVRRPARSHGPHLPQIAQDKKLDFTIELDPDLPRVDVHRRQAAAAGHQEPALQRVQVHRAGLRSSCRSARAHVRLDAGQRAPQHGRIRCWPSRSPTPASAFPQEKQRIIFEAFQQADGTTSRKYGGTGSGPFDQPRDHARCSAASSRSTARPARAARSRCICRSTSFRRPPRPPGRAPVQHAGACASAQETAAGGR